MLASVPAVSFSAVSEADFDDLADIRVAAMRESLERVGRFDPERSRQRLRHGFQPSHTRYILVDGERVGFVVFKLAAERFELEHFYILPAQQGLGIGAQVLRLLLAEAAAQQLPIRVGALRDSASNRFYLRHGFVLTARAEFDNYYLYPAPAR